MDGRLSVRGLEVQEKVLGGWNGINNTVDVDLHREDEYSAVECNGLYKNI